MSIDPGGYEYCKLFLRTGTRDTAIALLRSCLPDATIDGFCVTTGSIELDIMRNPARDLASADFVRWGVIVDVVNEEDSPDVVPLVAAIVRAGWDAGTPVVAACDYETQLPWAGGISRLAP